MSEPTQTPTPEKTPKPTKRPVATIQRNDSEYSTTSMDEDAGNDSRSRSQSRRRRRQNQRQRAVASSGGKASSGNANAESMASIEEGDDSPAGAPGQKPRSEWLNNPHPTDITEMQPFDRIKPASQSMNGPVTYARALRGEIPMRGAPPSQPLETAQGQSSAGKKDIMDQDGLKLRIELNIDIEIELKASIHGDLTLALLA